MALQVLAEKRKGKESPYLPYIEELPADFSSPLMWTDAELAELQYPYVLQEVRQSDGHWGSITWAPTCRWGSGAD
jgi:hypothetical protein